MLLKQLADPILSELEGVPDALMESAAETAEGGKGVTQVADPSGGQFAPIYRVRRTQCYTVTNSELKQIGLANLGATAFFTIGSLLAGFAIDVFKDIVLTEEVPDAAKQIIESAQPLLFTVAAAFYLIGFLAMLWRWDMIKSIKQESSVDGIVVKSGKWRLQSPFTRK